MLLVMNECDEWYEHHTSLHAQGRTWQLSAPRAAVCIVFMTVWICLHFSTIFIHIQCLGTLALMYVCASRAVCVCVPLSLSLALPLHCTAGTFLRGVLDKVGVEPQVQRIGAYKSAGDQLLRRDMSDAQREQLGELLDDIYEEFLDTVAEARGKTREVSYVFCVKGLSVQQRYSVQH